MAILVTDHVHSEQILDTLLAMERLVWIGVIKGKASIQ